jgi:hypothetical protein
MLRLSRFDFRSRITLGWLIVGFASLSIAIALALLAPIMAPVQRGTSAEFWECATAIHFDDSPSVVYGHASEEPYEGWFYYKVSGRDGGLYIEGSPTYRVPVAEVDADFDRVVAALRSPPSGVEVRPRIREGFRKFTERPEKYDKSPRDLLSDLRKAREAELGTKSPFLIAYHGQIQTNFVESHIRSHWYWFAILFEWAFLTWMVYFIVRPAMTNASWKQWSLRMGLLPLLFVLPAYLGYSTFAFTTSNNRGGVLYPFLVPILRSDNCSQFDLWILRHTPQLLEPISAGIYSPVYGIKGFRPGPTSVIQTGLILAAITAAVHFAARFAETRRASQVEADRPNVEHS